MLIPGEYVLWRDVANGAVQTDVVVTLYVTPTVSGVGTGSGRIKGTMAFDRKDYGMNSGIPFIRIADRVEVTVDLKVNRLSGPQLHLKP